MKQPGMSSTKVLSGLKIAGIEKSASRQVGCPSSPEKGRKETKKILETKPRPVDSVDLWNF